MSDSYFLHLDESYRGRMIAVGGFICDGEDLRDVEEAWIELREGMGIDYDEPLKWNFSQNNATRRRLDLEGFDNRERRRRMIENIRSMPITLLADVIYDDRESRRPPLDFYKEALDWLLLRFRNFVTDMHPAPSGPHVVVLDQPSPAPPARPGDDPRFAWLVNRETIWYHVYQRAYEEGWRFDWAQHNRVHSLRRDGFLPSAVVSHAKFNPLLEIADAVAGLSLDFAFYNVQEADEDELPEVGWQDEQFIKVAGKFRARPNGDILKWGFALFPDRAPPFIELNRWITRLCTDAQFGYLRD